MNKEYGKFTTDQFRAVIRKLPEVRHQREELENLLSSLPEEKLKEVTGPGCSWAVLYEDTFSKHLVVAMVAFGEAGKLKLAAASEDPQQFLLDNMDSDLSDTEPHPALSKQDLIGIAYSVQRTILCVMLFQRSMSGLLQEVREDDNLDSLFNAIRVDRTAINCPSIADKIARAQIKNDKPFFLRLRNALKGPTQKHWAAYCDLRYSLFALRELGFDKMTDAQLEELLVHQLKVYPNVPSAKKNLRVQYQQSRKIKTI
jgi:hypothetical protein